MKKIFAALLVLGAVTFIADPMTTTYAAAETVECSWWGKMVNGDYDDDKHQVYDDDEEESAASSNEDED